MSDDDKISLQNTAGDDDESIRVDIAVRALGDMRNRATATASSSGNSQASAQSSRDAEQSAQQSYQGSDFVSRMSTLPLVGTAMWAYEHSKASSMVVKYSAEMVESSVKTISKPVIDRLPVNQLDEFACRQLDKFDRYRRPSTGRRTSSTSSRSPSRTLDSTQGPGSDVDGPSSPDKDDDRGQLKTGSMVLREPTIDEEGHPNKAEKQTDVQDPAMESVYEGSDRSVPRWIESTSSYPGTSSRIDSNAYEEPSSQNRANSDYPDTADNQRKESMETQVANEDSERQVAQRSRWQAMLLEAGGLGVALSDENMRRLKFCLQWLQFATAHIDAQILILRDFIESIQPLPQRNSTSQRRPPISEEHLRKLTDVRKDIVQTVRQMVDVVSKYAGGALPEPARGRVRGFILNLPQRWATRNAVSNTAPGSGPPVVIGTESETIAAAGSSTGILRRGQGRDKRAALRERGTASRAPSPSSSSSDPHSHSHSHIHSHPGPVLPSPGSSPVSHSSATAAAQRILTLATESLDMMRNVTGVVKDSLDRADAWVNRLRMVGVQRAGQDGITDDPSSSEFDPRIGFDQRTSHSRRRKEEYRDHFGLHRRGESSSSAFEDDTAFSGSSPTTPYTASLSLGSGYVSSSYPSMPSTPTGTIFTSPNIPSSIPGRDNYGGAVASAPSPGAIPLAAMHITSKYNTPKMNVAGLSPEESPAPTKHPQGEGSLVRMEVDS